MRCSGEKMLLACWRCFYQLWGEVMRLLPLVSLIVLGSALAASAKMKTKTFMRLDLDEDGRLDPAEFIGTKTGAALRKAMKAFAALDKDDDSLVSYDEACRKPSPSTGSTGSSYTGISSSWTSISYTGAFQWVQPLPPEREISLLPFLTPAEESGTSP
jgi:hypothetical protein